MKLLKRTISLDDLKTKQEGLSYGIFTATSIYMKINLIQTIDDMGIVTNLPFERFGYPCRTLTGSIATTNITCYNGIGTPPTSGELTAVPLGGVEPYTYQWSNGGIGATISNLGPGIYDVIITDNEGCQITLRGIVDVTESDAPELIGKFTLDQYYRIPSSQGGYQEVPPNGYITAGPVNLNSLTVPYNTNTIILCTNQEITLSTSIPYSSYSWDTGSVEPNITIEEAGTYTVNVIGSDGCEGTSSITIEYINIPEPKFEFNKNPIDGIGTIDDPYVFCTDQYPVLLTLANSSYFDTWTWNTGVSDIVSIVPSNTGVLASYGFNNSGYISSICCPVGTPNCQQIQTPLIWIRYSNLPSEGCTGGIDGIIGTNG